ncbi:MAG: glycosyltransferase [Anderseniella sp.]
MLTPDKQALLASLKAYHEKSLEAFSRRDFQLAETQRKQVCEFSEAAFPAIDIAPRNPAGCCIAVVTYKPNDDFNQLIEFILNNILTSNPQHRLLVVNNSADTLAYKTANSTSRLQEINLGFNFGCSGARNVAANMTDCEYIAFVDDDGALQPGAICQLLKTITNFNAVAVRGRVAPRSPDGVGAPHYSRGDLVIPSLPDCEGISIWRTDKFRKWGGFNTLLAGHEGVWLAAKMLRFFGPEAFLYDPEALLYHDYSPSHDDASWKTQKHDRNSRYLAFAGIDLAGLSALFSRYRTNILKNIQYTSALESLRVYRKPAAGVSLITTAKNSLAFLDDYLASILNLDSGKLEVIYVDDNSDDGSFDKATSLAKTHPWLKVSKTAKPGRGGSLNCAVASASNDICLIADVDDISCFNRVNLTLKYFAEHPESACVSFVYFADDPGRGPANPAPIGKVSLLGRSLFGMPASFPAFGFRRSFFNEQFNCENSATLDYDWIVRNLLASGRDGHIIPAVASWYRLHDKQISSERRDHQIDVAVKTACLLHTSFVGPLTDEDIRMVRYLTGWTAMDPNDRELLDTHCSRLCRSIAASNIPNKGEILALVHSRLFEVRSIGKLPHKSSFRHRLRGRARALLGSK